MWVDGIGDCGCGLMVSVTVGMGRWVAQWVWVGGLLICSLGYFSGFLVFFTFFFFFFVDAGVDLVTQWEVGGWVDDGCLIMVAVGVVLRDDSVKRNDYFIE